MLDLHELTICVSEGLFSELLCIHNEGIGTFVLHDELILRVSEGFPSELLCIRNVNIDIFRPPYSNSKVVLFGIVASMVESLN